MIARRTLLAEEDCLKRFSIRGIPAYLLVSAEGEILTPGKTAVLAALN